LQKEKEIFIQKESSFKSVLFQKPLFKEKEFSQLIFKLVLQKFWVREKKGGYQLIFKLAPQKHLFTKANHFKKNF
jgi:hypothetical protein